MEIYPTQKEQVNYIRYQIKNCSQITDSTQYIVKLVQYSVTHFIQTSSWVTTLSRVTLDKGKVIN